MKTREKMLHSENETEELRNVSGMERESIQLLEAVRKTEAEMKGYYTRMLEEPDSMELQSNADSLKRATANITKALTQMYRVSDEFNARLKDMKKQKHKKRLRIPSPANAMIDYRERETNHFARGLNLYKVLLICFIGSFLGVVIELLWCLVKNGYLESRSGLVYGPFNLLYGVGAVLMTVCLYQFRNRGAWISFLGGMLVGSVLEYVCSWGQEVVFGSRSWDYSGVPFNLNGRICLLYSIFWGFLGVYWIKRVYPMLAKWILKLPNVMGKVITWVLVCFFVFNSIMTVGAMTRWTQRRGGAAPLTAVGEYMDEHFPDERMERIFANMEFMEEEGKTYRLNYME